MINLKKEYKELEPDTLVQELVVYIENQLPNLKSSPEFVDILIKKKNENQHSQSFCVFMTNQCGAKFNFQRENAQKGSTSIDIGVYRGSILFFTIEAKLLPIPQDSKRNIYEYVYGKGAGIQRFKDGDHGVDNMDNFIHENGMIAYVKENDFQTWLDRINQWILDANWGETEKLEKKYFKTTAKLISKHTRLDNSDLILHHFWVNVV